MTSGAFTYLPTPTGGTIGDGSNEGVEWSFNFTGDPGYPTFLGPLASAHLTLTLKPTNTGITTDIVRILGLPFITTPLIQNLAVGVTSTIDFDLLNFYTSAQVLGSLTSHSGQIPMHYEDDAFVTFAKLDLQNVPEPRTWPILMVGSVAMLVGLRLRRISQ